MAWSAATQRLEDEPDRRHGRGTEDLRGVPPEVGGQDDIVQVEERMAVGEWFGLRDVQGRPGDGALLEGGQEGVGIDHPASGRVDQEGRGLHRRQFRDPDQTRSSPG